MAAAEATPSQASSVPLDTRSPRLRLLARAEVGLGPCAWPRVLRGSMDIGESLTLRDAVGLDNVLGRRSLSLNPTGLLEACPPGIRGDWPCPCAASSPRPLQTFLQRVLAQRTSQDAPPLVPSHTP